MSDQTADRRYAAAGVSIEAGDRAVELMKVVGRQGPPPRGGRRHRRFRRALRRLRAQGVRPPAARDQRRRRRHQGGDRPGAGQARHDRLRPGRDAGRRPRRVRGRAAVPDRLHRLRAGRARADRGDRQGHRGGLRGGRLRPDRRRDRRAPRAARTRRVRRRRRRPPASSRPPSCSGPDRVRPGTCWSRWPSSGLHSNGYSLVRHVLLERAGWSLDRHVDELGRTLGEELLEPTRIYAKACLDAGSQTPAPTRCPTSPAAAWPRTSSACCRRPRRHDRPVDLVAAAGLRPGPRAWATWPATTSSAPSTAASAWSRSAPPTTPTP